MTRRYLHARYRCAEDAQAAIEALSSAGVPTSALELYSRRPVEVDPPLLPRRSRMSLAAVIAAIASGSTCTALVFLVQLSYPLVTGGMPITSGWATGVVTFETTMAGAVLGILVMFLWEAGLIRPRGRGPVPSLPEEGVLLQIDCRQDYALASKVVTDSSAQEIESIEC